MDLNLLPILLAVYETRNVGEAAARLNMSQPGVSSALRRARIILNDPLFVRTATGMEPTIRARTMVEHIRAVLTTVAGKISATPKFEAEKFSGEFCIALSDVGEATFLPILIHTLATKAPYAGIRTTAATGNALVDAMESGEIDLAIGLYTDFKTSAFYQQRIGTGTFSVVMRRDHPLITQEMSLHQFLECKHVVVESRSHIQEQFERFLKSKGIERRVTIRIPHAMSIPTIVSNTDLIATLPIGQPSPSSIGLASAIHNAGNLSIVPIGFPTPTFGLKMYWHRSAHQDEKNKWLRQTIVDDLRTLFRAEPDPGDS